MTGIKERKLPKIIKFKNKLEKKYNKYDFLR